MFFLVEESGGHLFQEEAVIGADDRECEERGWLPGIYRCPRCSFHVLVEVDRDSPRCSQHECPEDWDQLV
jgi:hypothetical protein